MPRWFGAAACLLGLTLALRPLAADDKAAKKDDDPPKKKDAAKDKAPADKQDKLTWGMELVGKLKIDGGSNRDFTLHVTQKILEPNFQAQQQYAVQQAQLAQQQLQMVRARTVQERIQAQQQYLQTAAQLAQTQRNLYHAKDVNADVQLRFTDKVKVRLAQPPVDYDDKGNLKRYTAKELQELRGKEGLPGFAGEFEALRSGQTVKVYLAKNATVAGQAAPGKGAARAAKDGKKKKADDDEDELGPARPEAVMIMVLHDPAPGQ